MPTVVRGGGTLKYSFQTSSNPQKFFKSVMKTCAFTTLSSELPAASNVLFQVVEDVPGLKLYVGAVIRKVRMLARIGRNAGLVVAGDLAGGEDEVAEGEGFGVVRQRPRRVGFDDLVLEARARHIANQVDLDQRVLHQ